MPTPLEQVLQRLEHIAATQRSARYTIPALWIPPHASCGLRVLSNPAAHYAELIRRILAHPLPERALRIGDGELFYLAYVRHLTAWDHDGSGCVSYEPGRDGWRQTGTFLKTIALLPYLRWLGATTLLLLPVTEHGRYRAKGTLGSPYAPRHHTRIEPTLAEPLLELGADVEFAALIEAAHRLGMKVVLEVALRVASLDCPLIAEHPDWFYWVTLPPGTVLKPPAFTADELRAIADAVAARNYSALPEPPAPYRQLFCLPPLRVHVDGSGAYVGTSDDGAVCTVPNGFADYPPDDQQPVWSDVTYFRLHSHPELNYIAYNTVRYYDRRLTGWENEPLWDYIAGVIPQLLARFDLDGILLDMGHAFPYALHRRIVECARAAKPELFLAEESFDRADLLAQELGYDAVVGDAWHYAQNCATFRTFALEARHSPSLRFFATPDTHNTPCIASRGIHTAMYCFAACSLLPSAIPVVTAGSELGELRPINTGLDFSAAERAAYPPEKLALFSGEVLCWDVPNMELLRFVRAIYAERSPAAQRHS